VKVTDPPEVATMQSLYAQEKYLSQQFSTESAQVKFCVNTYYREKVVESDMHGLTHQPTSWIV